MVRTAWLDQNSRVKKKTFWRFPKTINGEERRRVRTLDLQLPQVIIRSWWKKKRSSIVCNCINT